MKHFQYYRKRKEGKPWINRYMVNKVLRDFKSHYRRAGIKPVGKLTIYTLRKSCGQNWADNLPMNVVKELMGRSKVEKTLEFYNQIDAQHEEKAANVIQRLIEGAGKGNNSDKTDAKMTPEPISRQIGGVN